MKNLIKYILILSFILTGLIFLLPRGFKYLGEQQLKKLGIPLENLPPVKLEEIKPEMFKEETGNYKEFISPDGKIKIKYPSNWIEIKGEILEKITSEEYRKKYQLETLFSAQKFKIDGGFAQLVVSKGIFGAETSFEEIIKDMKEENQKKGWKMEILQSEEKNSETIFEAIYKKAERYDVHSKEKIVFLEQKEGKKETYFIAFLTLERYWQNFKDEADFIISSIQLTQ
jgi:hypothetical protein